MQMDRGCALFHFYKRTLCKHLFSTKQQYTGDGRTNTTLLVYSNGLK